MKRHDGPKRNSLSAIHRFLERPGNSLALANCIGLNFGKFSSAECRDWRSSLLLVRESSGAAREARFKAGGTGGDQLDQWWRKSICSRSNSRAVSNLLGLCR